MTRVVAFTLSLIAAGAASAQTEVESANYMLPGCRDYVRLINKTADPKTINAFAAGNCAGRIEGLLILRDDLLPDIRFCKPPSVTTGQATQMVVNWLEANPARWHENFVLLAHGVFKRAWPCKR
jgi:hypothetical protein